MEVVVVVVTGKGRDYCGGSSSGGCNGCGDGDGDGGGVTMCCW